MVPSLKLTKGEKIGVKNMFSLLRPYLKVLNPLISIFFKNILSIYVRISIFPFFKRHFTDQEYLLRG